MMISFRCLIVCDEIIELLVELNRSYEGCVKGTSREYLCHCTESFNRHPLFERWKSVYPVD